MKPPRLQRLWDRAKAEFVEVPIQYPPDITLPCKDCRYLDRKSRICFGIGSSYYMRTIPNYDFVPRHNECHVRLPPDLLSFVQC